MTKTPEANLPYGASSFSCEPTIAGIFTGRSGVASLAAVIASGARSLNSLAPVQLPGPSAPRLSTHQTSGVLIC
jgi:hypothetical protein